MKRSACCVSLLALAGIVSGATLKPRQILSVPWGSGAGQVGRDLAKGSDDTDAGPVGFYTDDVPFVCIADIFNHRVDVFDKNGQFLRIIDLPGGKNDTIEAVVASSQTIFALDLQGPGKPDAHILGWDPSGKVVQDIPLKPLGIKLPLYLERAANGDFFIQDNATFMTWRLDAAGNVLGKTPDDDRLMTLVSQGHYRFDIKGSRVQVLTREGRPLGYYWGERGSLQILGIDGTGTLYVIYDIGQEHFGFDRLPPDGHKRDTLTISDPRDKKLLDPDRFIEIRPLRIASDGSLYVMNDPTDPEFRIYRYQIQP